MQVYDNLHKEHAKGSYKVIKMKIDFFLLKNKHIILLKNKNLLY